MISPNILTHQPGYSFGCHHVPSLRVAARRFLQLSARFGHLLTQRFLHGFLGALEVEEWIAPIDGHQRRKISGKSRENPKTHGCFMGVADFRTKPYGKWMILFEVKRGLGMKTLNDLSNNTWWVS